MSKKMLVVDDIGFIIDFQINLVKEIAKEIKQEIKIDTAKSVAEANALIAKQAYDVVVVDLNLPDGNGVEIAKEISGANPTTRIAALTLSPEKHDENYQYFDLFLKKPILPAVYKEKLSALFQE